MFQGHADTPPVKHRSECDAGANDFDDTWAYDPAANQGSGAITMTLDKGIATLNLRDKFRAEGAQLDRFGLLSPGRGGSKVKIWFDDLEYTANANR